MSCAPAVVHPAHRWLRHLVPAIAALVVAATAIGTVSAGPVKAAYTPRVVIVVGPSGGSTRDYLGKAREYAAQAKAHGASVTSVLTPHATWERVIAAGQGANVFIYLGHGNGWPSRYGPYQGVTKNGLGLNPRDGSGNTKVKYYGENLVRAHLRLAPGAIVLLNRLCYASGNAEPGSPEPSLSTAVKRADNFAAGFLDAGAAAVVADGHTSLVYELDALFGREQALVGAWVSDPDTNGHVRSFASRRTPNTTVRLDPDRRNKGFYRSIVSRSRVSTAGIRTAAYWGTLRKGVVLRSGPSTGAEALANLDKGARVLVRGSLANDRAGHTWAPVITRSGVVGYVGAWLTSLSGSARARTSVNLRARPSTAASRRATVKAGVRVTVLATRHDRQLRTWLKVKTPSGRTGWVAGWLTEP
jgi:hypothetical protein